MKSVVCPQGHTLIADGDLAGNRLTCPVCGSVVESARTDLLEHDEGLTLDESVEQPADGFRATAPPFVASPRPALTEKPNRRVFASAVVGAALSAFLLAGLVAWFLFSGSASDDARELERLRQLSRELERASRGAKKGMYVSFEDGSDGGRTAILAIDPDAKTPLEVFREVRLDGSDGVPLFEYGPEYLQEAGWTDDLAKPVGEADRKLLRQVRETDLFRIHTLSDFGTGEFDRDNRPMQSFDHRHVWSPDGASLYVLAGYRNSAQHPLRLLKINARTWETELELRPPKVISDIALTSQGLLAVQGSSASGTIHGKYWTRLVPAGKPFYVNSRMYLLDPQTLALRHAWAAGGYEVAGHPNTDLVYLRNYDRDLQVANVRTGELVRADTPASLTDAQGQVIDESIRKNLRFVHPHLTADGKWLITHGTTDFDVQGNAHGTRKVNRFRLSGASVTWDQSIAAGEVRSRYSRLADIGIGEAYVCLPDDKYEQLLVSTRGTRRHLLVSTRATTEVAAIDDFNNRFGRLSVLPDAAVAVDSDGKTIYVCGPNWEQNRLELRVICGTADIDVVVTEKISDEAPPSPPREKRARNALSERDQYNIWPFEMSVSPDGRGVLVFTEEAAYWVERKFGAGERWAFDASLPEDIAEQDVGNGRSGESTGNARDTSAQRQAAVMTRAKAATALLLIPSKKASGTAFCIDERGYFLTNAHHFDQLQEADDVNLVVHAGGFHECSLSATVVRIDTAADLALLKVADADGLWTLKLGHDDSLSEATPLTAFGYPLVGEQRADNRWYPAPGTNVGNITALRNSDDRLETIQFDGPLVPGNSGGPVVDAEGQVVGIVRSGIKEFALNFITPVSKLRKLEWPEISSLGEPLVASTHGRMTTEARSAAKAATALVVLPSGKGFGSAFCVDKQGFFVTNAHVVEGVQLAEKVTLVLYAADKWQREVSATVIRYAPEWDLALLNVDNEIEGLTVLGLGADEAIAERVQVAALGFPFGDALAVRGKKYPEISINTGPITATNIEAMQHEAIEFVTQVNPGNSGGPLIDNHGKVVGVVFATKIGARQSYAIPVGRVRELMYAPELKFVSPEVTFASLREETKFEVTATSHLNPDEPLELELSLDPEYGPRRRYALSKLGSGNLYSVQAAPLTPDIPNVVEATFDFKEGSVSGLVADLDFSIGGKTCRLSGAPSHVLLGRPRVRGLEHLSFKIANSTVEMDCSKAIRATIEGGCQSSFLDYAIVARTAGSDVAQVAGRIKVGGLPRPPACKVEEIQLPKRVSKLTVGGGGRWIILFLPGTHELAIFDAMAARIVHTIGIPECDGLRWLDAHFAAGQSKLLVLLPKANEIQRWDLKTVKLEKTATLPVNGEIKQIRMGSASDGPLLIHSVDGTKQADLAHYSLIDIDTLRVSDEFSLDGVAGLIRPAASDGVQLKVSDDGRTVGLLTRRTLQTVVLGEKAVTGSIPTTMGTSEFLDFQLGPTGEFVYTGTIIRSPAGKILHRGTERSVFLPAHDARYYFGALSTPLFRFRDSRGDIVVPTGLAVYAIGATQPLTTVPHIDAYYSDYVAQRGTGLSREDRLHLIPQANLLVTIPRKDDRLVLHHLGIFDAREPVTEDDPTSQSEVLGAEATTGSVAHLLKVTLKFDQASVSGIVADRRFKIDGREYSLSEVIFSKMLKPSPRDLERRPNLPPKSFSLFLKGGGRGDRRGESGTQLLGLNEVPVRIGEKEIVVDFSEATDVAVGPLNEPGETHYPLYSQIADVVAGGNGRWLILHLPELRKLAIFDLAARQVVHEIPLVEDRVLFAAGASKLIVVHPNSEIIQRWDLKTSELELTVGLPIKGQIGTVAMGSGSDGPLLVHWFSLDLLTKPRWSLIDVTTFEVTDVSDADWDVSYPESPQLTISADGTVVGGPGRWLILNGESASAVQTENKAIVIPRADGRHVYSHNRVLTRQGSLVDGTPKADALIPTADANYFLALRHQPRHDDVTVYSTRDNRTVAEFPTFDFHSALGLPLRKRFFLGLDSTLLVTIPGGDDHLILREIPH